MKRLVLNEAAWRKLTRKSHPATNVWTDAYLVAFAKLRELQVVTFDQAFRRSGIPLPGGLEGRGGESG